jgi:transcriptional regulator with XRE-family HTH domain
MDDRNRLGSRLRALREAGFGGGPVTQRVVAAAFGKSVPLVSSWEKGKAVPSPEWLNAYARFFATPRSYAGGQPRLLPVEDLRDEERDRFEQLLRELTHLRTAAEAGPAPAPGHDDEVTTHAPWEGLWHFADRAPITLACARLPTGSGTTSPESPDYVELHAYSDLDALLELHGHVHAANPGVTVHRKLADELDQSDVTNHLVLLGGVDRNPMTRRVMTELHLPVTQDDAGSFRARGQKGGSTAFSPKLAGEPPHRQILEDVAHFCRAPNPFNRKRSVTICNGTYPRGTYAAVRTLTDPRFRDRNRAYAEQRYGREDTYSILARVLVVAGEVITPDWTHSGTVLHEWSAA